MNTIALENLSLAELKAKAAELNVPTPTGDKRKKTTWIKAIKAHQIEQETVVTNETVDLEADAELAVNTVSDEISLPSAAESVSSNQETLLEDQSQTIPQTFGLMILMLTGLVIGLGLAFGKVIVAGLNQIILKVRPWLKPKELDSYQQIKEALTPQLEVVPV